MRLFNLEFSIYDMVVIFKIKLAVPQRSPVESTLPEVELIEVFLQYYTIFPYNTINQISEMKIIEQFRYGYILQYYILRIRYLI